MTAYLERRISTEMAALAPFHDELPMWSARFGSLLLDQLEIRRNIRGLDIGCGTGFPLIELAQIHGPSSHFVGVDVWAEALEIARQKIDLHRIPNVECQLADASKLPFEDRSFDLVTSNLGINNFEHPADVMSEVARVSRARARLAITTNPIGTMPEVYEVFREVLADVDPTLLPRLDEQEAHRGTVQSAMQLVADAGFRITRRLPGEFSMVFADGAALFGHILVAWFIEGWREAIPERIRENVFAKAEEIITGRSSEKSGFRTTIKTLYLEAERE